MSELEGLRKDQNDPESAKNASLYHIEAGHKQKKQKFSLLLTDSQKQKATRSSFHVESRRTVQGQEEKRKS